MKSSFLNIIFSCCCLIIFCFSSIALNANNDNPQNKTDKTLNLDQTNTIFNTLAISEQEVLNITIKTAIDSLTINKKTQNYYPAIMSYTDAKGISINREVKLKPRGRSRRKHCSFPPLKIKFSKEELQAEGIRDVHKSLKLVTHCNEVDGAQENVLEEYLAYKIYNELSNQSLKVQLVKINYEDTNTATSFERYGIILEDIDELAERMDGKEVEGFGKDFTAFNTNQINIFATFQYMIGNEDWRVPFMRNVKFIELNKNKRLVAVPYDFDASGLVSANYAKPDADLRLKTVRQRAYMGIFNNETQRNQIVRYFNKRKDAIKTLIKDFNLLDKKARNAALAYVNSFYQIINDPSLIDKAMPVNGDASVPTNEEGDFSEIR